MKLALNYRFCERDAYFKKILHNSPNLTIRQVEQILDGISNTWDDLTFKFYEDGAVVIIDNNSNEKISPKDLRGAAYDYYIQKRIELIKVKIKAGVA